jgi:hypothetical protein
MKERAWQDDVHVHACLIYMHVHALAEGTILFNHDLEVWTHLHTGKYQAISISYSHVQLFAQWDNTNRVTHRSREACTGTCGKTNTY